RALGGPRPGGLAAPGRGLRPVSGGGHAGPRAAALPRLRGLLLLRSRTRARPRAVAPTGHDPGRPAAAAVGRATPGRPGGMARLRTAGAPPASVSAGGR